MSEKVKITRDQAEALKKFPENKKSDIVRQHIVGRWLNEYITLNHLNTDELIKALYIGYEVEPEYSVGDYVVTDTGIIGKITHFNPDNDNHAFLDVKLNNGTGRYANTFIRYFRHATSSEIAAEKERRWWRRHGRDVWELREKDMLIDSHGNVHEVTGVPYDLDSRYYLDYVAINFYEIKGKYSVLVFAENRLDVSE